MVLEYVRHHHIPWQPLHGISVAYGKGITMVWMTFVLGLSVNGKQLMGMKILNIGLN